MKVVTFHLCWNGFTFNSTVILKDVVCGAVELEYIKHRGVSITETALTDIHDVKKMVKLSV